jgi:hypothetical protein
MPFPRSAVAPLSVALVLGACAGPSAEVSSKASPTADFRTFKTYAFLPADRMDDEGSQMRDPVTRRNIEAAIARELQAKGLSPAGSETPSLLVAYFADVYQGVDRKRPSASNMTGENWQRQGELTVTLIDAATQQTVWHGEAWVRDPSFKKADEVVADLFRMYPPPR